MPTYEYRCENDHVFEVFHGIKDDTPRTCPECGAASRRVPAGGAGLLFRGSGFYATDYRSASYKERRKAESGGGKAPESKPSGGDGGSPPPKGD